MKHPRLWLVVLAMTSGTVMSALAHPHFGKTIVVKLPSGTEVTLTYNTTPANEMRASEVKVGSFVTPRRPTLKLSGELKAGNVTLAAGEYTIGVVKNGDNDWTMGLYPGNIERGANPDPAKVIKLDSAYSPSQSKAEHMLIDITPGSGRFEGKPVLTLHFGSMFLAAALS
jgi:hypothetical protein